ncbi:MAG: hypothetical protein V2I56_07015 [Desulfobacteraceae bacterium]|nr:hypothetical protein [Desulfobacteraceae bacterium]
MNVACQHSRVHIPFKTADAVVETAVQPMVRKRVDRRFHGRMLGVWMR